MADNELDLAEQQLTGFAHAKAGYEVPALAESMGLTKYEWEAIKQRGMVKLDVQDVASLDVYFSK